MVRDRRHQAASTTRRFAAAGAATIMATAGLVGAADTASGETAAFGWQVMDTGTGAFLATLDAVSADVAWVGSSDGDLLRTVDGGVTFDDVAPENPNIGSILTVEAASADVALVLATGTNGSLIYRTVDGGSRWSVSRTAPDHYSCLAMFDRRNGFVVGTDQTSGEHQVLRTHDGGRSWDPTPPDGIPPPITELESAGGPCETTGQTAFFTTGAGQAWASRVFRSDDGGLTWTASPGPFAPIIRGLDFRTSRLGVASGGDSREGRLETARTTDGAATWDRLRRRVAPTGFPQDFAWWFDGQSSTPAERKTVFTVGSASSVSHDAGKSWTAFDETTSFWEVDCVAGRPDCWAAGQGGLTGRLLLS